VPLDKSSPVVYKDGREEFISNPAEFPDTTDPKMRVAHIEEPMGEPA
jgi:GTP-binding protein LepA